MIEHDFLPEAGFLDSKPIKVCVIVYTQFFYKGLLIRDGNMGLVGLVEISKKLGIETCHF